MTLKEIAKEAGVSVSTVSRVINQENTKAASPKVQARIWEIIRRTGYSPNKTARNLKLGQSAELRDPDPKSIACVYARTHTDMSDPFFSQIVKALELEAIKSRYFIRYSFTSQDLGRPETAAQLTQFPADGIVVLGRYDQRIASLVSNLSKNVVYTGLIPMDFQFDQVVCDGSEIVYTAISYLKSLGHSVIGYIGEQDKEPRFSGYKEALSKLDLPFAQRNTANVHQTSEGGYEGMKMLARTCDDLSAILCANDRTAIGVLHALKKLNFRVPEDISVISIDDIDIAQYMSPMLTTVHIPTDELGKMAFKVLLDRVSGGHRMPLKTFLPYYIAKRDSCCPFNRDRRLFSTLRQQASP